MSIEKQLALAVAALGAGENAKAADIAEALRRGWPDDAGVRHLLAAVAWRQSRPADAETWAMACLAIRPDHVPAWMLAAVAARALGHWPDAHARYARAAQIDPARPEPAFGAAIAALALTPAEAVSIVAALARRFPAPAPAWTEIGAACERAGQSAAAVDAYGLALKAQPSAQLHLRLGSALHRLGRRGEAAAALQSALQLDPGLAEAWFKLGLVLQDSCHPKRAAEAYRRALKLRPELAEAEANLGVVLQDQGDLDAAKQAYGRALNLMPSAFGRIAQALATAPKGELWLDSARLRAHLSELGRLSR